MLEPPRRGGSNVYSQSMFWAEIWKFINFLVVIFSIYLYRRVFVMEVLQQSNRLGMVSRKTWGGVGVGGGGA